MTRRLLVPIRCAQPLERHRPSVYGVFVLSFRLTQVDTPNSAERGAVARRPTVGQHCQYVLQFRSRGRSQHPILDPIGRMDKITERNQQVAVFVQGLDGSNVA